MQFVKLVVLLLFVALVASAFNVKGLEFLASDGAKWVCIIGIIVGIAKLIGVGKTGL